MDELCVLNAASEMDVMAVTGVTVHGGATVHAGAVAATAVCAVLAGAVSAGATPAGAISAGAAPAGAVSGTAMLVRDVASMSGAVAVRAGTEQGRRDIRSSATGGSTGRVAAPTHDHRTR